MLRLLPFLLLFQTAIAQKTDKRELRGAWITTYLGLDWPVRTQTPAQQRTALVNILNSHQVTGINTVFFQVRGQADAFYPSTLVPWSYDLTGTQGTAPNPLWDPLDFAITESHKRNFEFHAWLNPFRAVPNTANAGNTTMYGSTHVSRTNPQWMLTIGTVQIINPGIAEARAHVVSVVTDIVRRYDVDGIHFDDYFYPSGTINDDAQYNADPRGFPATTAGRADWRRDNVNRVIQAVYDSIRTIKPWVKFGVSPSGIYRSSTDPAVGSNTSAGAAQHYSSNFADTKKWLQEGWVDYIAPQVYWYRGQAGSDYDVLVPWWNNNAFGRHIYIGLADYKVNDPAQNAAWMAPGQLPGQVRLNRSATYPNVVGSIHFRTQHLVANPLGIRDSLRLNLYSRPALQPRMPWRDATAPEPATTLSAFQDADSVVLRWTRPAPAANELDRARQYLVYRSLSTPVDTANPANMLAIVGDTAVYVDRGIAANTTYYYTVTALDRFHNESAASNTAQNVVLTSTSTLSRTAGELLVSPNPSNGHFVLRVPGAPGGITEVSVVNAAGAVVERHKGLRGDSILVLGGAYRPGLYFVEVIAGRKRARSVLVKL